MEDEKWKNIPITTLLLTYLFVCGVLYLIGFWSTFDIDVFSLISIYDIPKSFAFPLLISQGFFVLNVITGNVSDLTDDRENRDHFITINPEWKGIKRGILYTISSINLWVICSISLMAANMYDYKNNSLFWVLTSLIVSYYLLHKFVNLDIVKKNFKNRILRYFIGHFIVFFPISCLSTGKIQSISILHNNDNKYISIININRASPMTDTTRVKLLGFISDRIIYGTLDNKRTYILNKSACDGILLTKK